MSTVSSKKRTINEIDEDNNECNDECNNDDNDEFDNEETKEETKEETNKEDAYDDFKYDIPKLSDNELKEFSEEVITVYKHKCKWKLNDNGLSISFYPAPHVKENEYGKEIFNSKLLCETRLKYYVSQFEAMNNWNEKVIIEGNICSFIEVCCKAWSEHYPLRISPANILLLILQGIAIHVDKNSEKLRNKYVTHSGKQILQVLRGKDTDNWVMGSRNNDWISVINEFCQQIDKNTVQNTVSLMESDFSCSTIVDKISNKITIMDICKNYFEYRFGIRQCCGFPKITLEGTKLDWIKLRIKCEKILNCKVEKRFGTQWSLALLPILDRFIAVYDGNIDCIFWNSMVKKTERQYRGSGAAIPQKYTGWINTLFPYIQIENGFTQNHYCFEPYKMKSCLNTQFGYIFTEDNIKKRSLNNFGNGGYKCSKYPTGLSSAPVIMKDYDTNKKYPLKFYSGFMGYKQCPNTFELSSVVSWFIGHDKKSN